MLRTNGHAILLAAMLVLSCAKDGHEPSQPTDQVTTTRDRIAGELMLDHARGFAVVSVREDGTAASEGEGLIFGGIAMWSLSCEENDAISAAMADMVTRHNGALVRYEPLGEYANGREVTWDGAVGFYLGVADDVVRCGRHERWTTAYAKHLAYLEANHGAYYAGAADAAAAPGYDTVHRLIAHRLGLRGAAHHDAVVALSSAIGATMAFVASGQRKACYHANLAFQSMLTMQTLGVELDGVNRGVACRAAASLGIPTWDHYCGVRHLDAYLAEYVEDEWDFRFQRCAPPRETPDGKGVKRSGIDFLQGYRIARGG